jgi:hypothetical protein
MLELVGTLLATLADSSFHTPAEKRGQRTRAGTLMEYPRSFVILWTLGPWVVAIILIVLIRVNPPAPLGVVLGPALVFVTVTVFGLATGWEARTRKILVTDRALIQLLRDGRMRRVSWSQVTRVTRGVMLGGFVVTDGRRRILVGQGLTGRSTFARVALERVSRSAMVSCEHVLQEAAAAERR